MITYTRQQDGTYVKAGEFAAVPGEVKIRINDGRPFTGNYTLAQAQEIIEDAIRKNSATKELYTIYTPEVAPAKVREPKAPRVKKVKEPKAPKVPKYDVQQFAQIYKNTKSLEDVVKATGASRAYAHRALVKLGLYEKPAAAAKPEVVLTPEEETRVTEILATFTETVVGNPRKLAIKQLRKEQRAANKAANATPKAPRVLKYDPKQFAEIYTKNGNDANAVVIATGASKVYVIRTLTKLGVYVKPAKAEKPAAVETPAAAPVEASAPAQAETPAPAAEEPKPAKKEKAAKGEPKAKKSAEPKAAKS